MQIFWLYLFLLNKYHIKDWKITPSVRPQSNGLSKIFPAVSCPALSLQIRIWQEMKNVFLVGTYGRMFLLSRLFRGPYVPTRFSDDEMPLSYQKQYLLKSWALKIAVMWRHWWTWAWRGASIVGEGKLYHCSWIIKKRVHPEMGEPVFYCF